MYPDTNISVDDDDEVTVTVELSFKPKEWKLRKAIYDLYEDAQSIVGNAYAIEGKNVATGDEDGEVSKTVVAAPYIRAGKTVGPWS